jgi:hypothetical protein
LRILRGSPRRHLAVAKLRHCHGRFHRCMRQKGYVVFGFNRFAGLGEYMLDVANVTNELGLPCAKCF